MQYHTGFEVFREVVMKINSSEMSAEFQMTKSCYIPESVSIPCEPQVSYEFTGLLQDIQIVVAFNVSHMVLWVIDVLEEPSIRAW
jgi:hypothetical protein